MSHESETRSPEGWLTTEPQTSDEPTRAPPARGSFVEVVASPDASAVGSRAELSRDLVAVGRDLDGPGIRIDDRRLSRVHGRFTYDGRAGAYRFGDARSKNGSFVNGRRVDTVLVTDGDVVRVGNSVLVVHGSDAMGRLRERAAAVASSDLTVLVRGETGTGKEVLARSLHAQSGRAGEFVAVNCASLPRELVVAELFGHTRGAFSGAANARPGLFQTAHGGTIFLDEIGDCPLEAQSALLRVLQEKTVRSLGAHAEVAVDVRVVAATHASLEDAIEARTFRQDLYARLAQAVLALPPLRARRPEIMSLARTMVADFGAGPLRVSPDAAEALLCWSWPMNVRELQSLVRSFAVATGAREPMDLGYLEEFHPEVAGPFSQRKDGDAEKPFVAGARPRSSADLAHLRTLLEQHDGNVSAVATAMGKPRAQIYRWMKALGTSARRFRK